MNINEWILDMKNKLDMLYILSLEFVEEYFPNMTGEVKDDIVISVIELLVKMSM
jgi:hypothetical protein